MFKLDIDTSNFNNAIKGLARYSGAPLATVVEHEAARVLEAAIRYTPAANISKIRDQHEASEFSSYPAGFYTPTSPQGKRHRATMSFGKSGQVVYYRGNRYPAALWGRIVQARKDSLLKKLRARGLSKKSWFMIGVALGLDIRVPGYVAKAVATTGKDYPQDVSAVKTQTHEGFGILCENNSPIIDTPGVRGRAALQRAINGREKYFATNLKKGALFDLKKLASKYPGLEIG